jgi:hypothetical protein
MYRIDVFMLALLPFIIAYLATVLLVMRILQDKHHETWERLGSPSALNLSIRNSSSFVRYVLFQSAFRELGDARLNRSIAVTRVLFWFACVGILAHIFGFISWGEWTGTLG